MQGYSYSNKVDDIFGMLENTLRNPGPGYSPRKDQGLVPCLNFPDVISSIKSFIPIAERYGWYRYYLKEHKLDSIPEVGFNHVRVLWEEEKGTFWRMSLLLNPQMLIIVDANYPYGSYLKSNVVCRKLGCHELPDTLLEMGIKEVRYPQALVIAAGILPQVLGTPNGSYIHENVITYSLVRLKIPQVAEKDLPLYINANPVVKRSINFDKLKGAS